MTKIHRMTFYYIAFITNQIPFYSFYVVRNFIIVPIIIIDVTIYIELNFS